MAQKTSPHPQIQRLLSGVIADPKLRQKMDKKGDECGKPKDKKGWERTLLGGADGYPIWLGHGQHLRIQILYLNHDGAFFFGQF